MAYFRVILRYRCMKRHSNQVERFYDEKDQEAVSKRVLHDRLYCYGCEPPMRINPPRRVPLYSTSIPLGSSDFQKLPRNAIIGVDHSWRVSDLGSSTKKTAHGKRTQSQGKPKSR